MKRIKILFVLLLLLGITPMTTGCSNSNNPKQEEKEKTEKSRGIVDDYSDKIILDGKETMLPTTLKQLGSEYSFGLIRVEYENNDGYQCVQTDIYKDGKALAITDLIDTTKKEMDDNSIIYSFKSKATEKDDDTFVLAGLHSGMKKEKITKVLGEPSIKNEGDFGFESWDYFNENGKSKYEYISISVNKGVIFAVLLNRYPEKYRK